MSIQALDGFPTWGEELKCCADCRRPHTIWYADNDLWNRVMRPDGEHVTVDGMEPFLCASCFLIRAEPLVEIARVTFSEVPSMRDRGRTAATASRVLLPGQPVLVDADASPGSALWRRGDRGQIVRRGEDGVRGWLVEVNGHQLWFDADELLDASERRR